MAIIRVRDENGNLVEIPAIKGEAGHTPARGIDYWTVEDVANIETHIENYIDTVLSDIGVQAYRTGAEMPSDDLGEDGDLFLITEQ